MKIKDIPKIDRPREKLLHYGPARLTDAELLAVIFGTGKRGESSLELAKRILKKFSYKEFAQVEIDYFKKIDKLGPVRLCQLLACLEIGKRTFGQKQDFIISPKEIWNDLKIERESKKEHFVVFYLDVRNKVIKKELVSVGILNANLVHPREVFEPAVRYLAAQIILAHNHPSGDPQPSDDDLMMTNRLVKAGKLMGIEVIDHVIVVKDNYLSFKEKRFIS
jgi:DNA repair protein RadC